MSSLDPDFLYLFVIDHYYTAVRPTDRQAHHARRRDRRIPCNAIHRSMLRPSRMELRQHSHESYLRSLEVTKLWFQLPRASCWSCDTQAHDVLRQCRGWTTTPTMRMTEKAIMVSVASFITIQRCR
ncbi:hypothetical protein ACN47E_008177 [Coniothyrium glycines]